jgi:hypothetical protein
MNTDNVHNDTLTRFRDWSVADEWYLLFSYQVRVLSPQEVCFGALLNPPISIEQSMMTSCHCLYVTQNKTGRVVGQIALAK